MTSVCAVKVNSSVEYTILDDALSAAQEGNTVKLLRNCTEKYVVVPLGVTLDLAGFELTTDYAVAFDTAHIVDSVGTGELIASVENVVLDESNAMVPVYDGDGYIFTKAGFAIRQNEAYTDGFKIEAVACPVNMDVVELLKNGGADNNLQVMILLTWDTEEGTGSQKFVFNDEIVASVYSSNQGTWSKYEKMFSMVITGYEGIENLNARIVLVSGTNVEYASSQTVSIT